MDPPQRVKRDLQDSPIASASPILEYDVEKRLGRGGRERDNGSLRLPSSPRADGTHHAGWEEGGYVCRQSYIVMHTGIRKGCRTPPDLVLNLLLNIVF